MTTLTRKGLAMAWLTRYLTEQGSAEASKIKEEALAAGHAEATISRAARELGMVIESHGPADPGRYSNRRTTWRLP